MLQTIRVQTAYRMVALLVLLFCALPVSSAPAAGRQILVYTRNQTGKGLYVHDNMAACAEAIQKLGAENGFAVQVADDPKLFTEANLKRYSVVVFDNTNNEVLETEEHKTAFQRYIRGGGGFVGIHSASGTMRQWPWFWSLLGGKFKRHPRLQPFTVLVKDKADISTAHLGDKFEWTDEFYYVDNMAPGLHVLLAGDLKTLDDPQKDQYPGKLFGDEFPLAWRHEFEGGRAWYTALGHKKEHYSDPRLTRHILGGILWAMGEQPK